MKQFRNALLITCLLAGLMMVPQMRTAVASDGDSNFTNVVATGDITASDDLTVGGDQISSKQDAITVTDGAAFAPTGKFQPITAAGAVTPTITVKAAGFDLVLFNSGTNAILIVDTGTTKLSSSYTMGQYDSLHLVSDGTNWIEIGRSNN